MKKEKIYAAAATFVATAAVLCSMVSCKGRTMENMEPTGDTVEVRINVQEGEDPDIPSIDSIIPDVR